MSARHALLGLLLHKESYPYELADRLSSRLGPAWAINSGQVSQTIKALERDGLIERVDRTAESRDDRHVFRISECGAQEFERWFDETAGPVRLSRRPLLVKITLAGPERLQAALEQIDAYERGCAERLKALSREHDEVPNEVPHVRADHVLLRLNLSADIIQLEGELRWARHAHEMVSWLLGREAIWPSAGERRNAASREAQRAREELFGRMAARQQPQPTHPQQKARRSGGVARSKQRAGRPG